MDLNIPNFLVSFSIPFLTTHTYFYIQFGKWKVLSIFVTDNIHLEKIRLESLTFARVLNCCKKIGKNLIKIKLCVMHLSSTNEL